MSKRLQKNLRGERPALLARLRPRTPAGIFTAGLAVGLVLAAVAVFAERAWSRAGGPQAAPSAEASRQAESSLRKAADFLKGERYRDAFREYTRAARLAPGDFRPYFGLGRVYENLERIELAERCYRKALERSPEYAPGKLKLAQTLNQTGRHAESIRLLKSLLEEDRGKPVLLWGLGHNELRRGHPEEAVRWFDKYTKALPANAYGYAYLGRAHADLGHDKLAERYYRKALSLDSNLFTAWLWLGQLLVATGRRSEAKGPLERFDYLRGLEERVRRCQRKLLRKPRDVETLVELARMRSLLGRTAEALVPLRKALELQPDNEKLRRLYQELAARPR